MTSAARVALTYEVWTHDAPLRPLISSDDDPRENPAIHHVGTYNMVEEATAAAKATNLSPLCYIDASRDLADVSYAGVFVLTVKRDTASGLRIYDRR